MRTLLIGIAIVAAGTAGFAADYVREHRQLTRAEAQVGKLTVQVDEARSTIRVHALYDELLDLAEDAADQSQYDRAQKVSTEFFDDVRSLAFSSAPPGAQERLRAVLDSRDRVTTALAKRDPSVAELLATIRKEIHPLLVPPGAPIPEPPTNTSASATAPQAAATSAR